MKKQLLIFACLLMCFEAFSQNKVNLVIFSEDLEPFYVYVNGIKQNGKAETNVRIANISPNIALRVEFENKALPVIKQNMALEAGFEHSARLKKDKNQVMKLRYFGQVPLDEAVTDNSVQTVNYHTSELPPEPMNNSTAGGTHVNVSDISVTSTTTTTQLNNGKGETTNMSVTMPGVNINMNISDPLATPDMHTTTSQTIITTSSSSGGSTGTQGYQQSPSTDVAQTSNTGCSAAMSSASFSKMKQSVESKPFSDTKMSTAKVATKNACLSVQQVIEIAKLFSMDEDKLAYAKFAYDRCVDKANYYQVGEIFSFSTTTDELNKFLDK